MNEDVFWSRGFVVNLLFYEGDNKSDFYLRLKDFRLNLENRSRALKLLGVCKRLELVERLHHPTYLTYKDYADGYWLDRLAVYLTTTCIDVLAGNKHISYPNWLKKAISANSQSNNLSSAIDALSDASSRNEVTKLFGKWSNTLFEEDYLNETGIGRLFKKLILDLPEWLKKWLADTYIILDKAEPLKSTALQEWLQVSVEEKCNKIANYLYQEARNKHTHTVEYIPVMNSETHGTFQVTLEGIDYGFSSFYESEIVSSSTETIPKLSVGLRNGIAESDVIRLIIVAKLRSWLDILDDESFIQRYLEKAQLNRLTLRFLFEVKYNRFILERWCLDYTYLEKHHGPLNLLKNNVPESFRNKCKIEAIAGEVNSYSKYLNLLNTKIEDYHENQARLKPFLRWQEERTFIRQLAESTEVTKLIQHIRTLQSTILKTVFGDNKDFEEDFFGWRMQDWLTRYHDKYQFQDSDNRSEIS